MFTNVVLISSYSFTETDELLLSPKLFDLNLQSYGNWRIVTIRLTDDGNRLRRLWHFVGNHQHKHSDSQENGETQSYLLTTLWRQQETS